MFDLSRLPKKAQEELLSYYQYLVERYNTKGSTRNSDEKSRKETINSFFDKYNLDLKGFLFNRDEIYES